MAINMNAARANGHHSIIGQSGSGKSSWVRSKDCPLHEYKFQIYWDVDEDYNVHRYRSKSAFARALKAAVASGKPYKIALTLDDVTKDNYEFFCACVWQIADGSRDTAVVVEELADVTTQGKAGRYSGQLMRKGRKYGIDVFAVSQRPAEIDKTTYTQTVNRWCGYLDNEIDIKRMAGVMGVGQEYIKALNPLDYLYKKQGQREPMRAKVKIKK